MMKSKLHIVLLLFPAVVMTAGCSREAARIGQPLPAWSEGCLDIHTINAGRGDCALIVMPDGTSLAIDAGEFSREPKHYRTVAQRPDTLTRPSTTYARYMRHFIPHKDSLDYFLLTHFHMDHFGQLEPEYERKTDGDYILSGVTALYEQLPFRTIVDRAYPHYDSLAFIAMSDDALANYRRFIAHATSKNRLKASALDLGSRKQFALRHKPDRYPDFSIMGLCANGRVWEDGTSVDYNPDGKMKENGASCGILVSYGDFDYFTAGDTDGRGGVEIQCARAIGRPIEAMRSSHHLSPKSMEAETVALLQPDVVTTTSFYIRKIQPDQQIIRRLTDTLPDVRLYFTNIDASLVDSDPQLYARCAAIGGHIVIRVLPGGGSYYVYMLDDTDNEYRVTKIDGPFKCKKQ